MAERAVLYARRGVFSLALRSASRRWRVAATARWFYTAVTPSTRRADEPRAEGPRDGVERGERNTHTSKRE